MFTPVKLYITYIVINVIFRKICYAFNKIGNKKVFEWIYESSQRKYLLKYKEF